MNRRNFLKGLLSGAALVAVGGVSALTKILESGYNPAEGLPFNLDLVHMPLARAALPNIMEYSLSITTIPGPVAEIVYLDFVQKPKGLF